MGVFKCRFSAYSVSFSPYSGSRLAVACSQYFGIVGNGEILVLESSGASLVQTFCTLTQDNIFDVCWNEGHERQLLAASGDKTVKLFDIAQAQPLLVLAGHTGEVFGVHGNYQTTQLVVSASYDGTLKLWDLASASCLGSFAEHRGIVYAGVWHPKK
jgi:peroxin-7